MKNISAFPHENFLSHRGMTLRDYFAAKAMQGLVAGDIEPKPENVPRIVKSAYIMADEMMKAREK
jgi:hypothetical protein